MLNPEIVAQFREFSIGPLTYSAYGLIIGIALLTGTLLFYKLGPKSITKHPTFELLLIYTIIPAIIFGRLLFVLTDIQTYLTNPLSIIAIWDGGITIFGVILGGIGGYSLYWWSRVKDKPKSYPYLLFLDTAVPFFALAQAIGRWGNFINQELYGFQTDLPWKMYISPAYRVPGYNQYEYFHPAFLYESILSLVAFVLLYYLYKKSPENLMGKGFLFGLYLTMYGIIRILLERVRIDSTPILWEIKLADIAAAVFITVGSILIVNGLRHAKNSKNRE